ncbi:MAG: LysR family transcriptional regulator [Cyanobacteria bacterium P01_F01_bin.53]
MAYLPQLRTFIAAYRLGSLTKAAEQLGITQPAASQQVRTLEAQIKKPLFVRHARGIVPTAIAHDLARSIGPHIDGIETGFSAVQARATNISGTIHLAGPGAYLSAKIIPLMAGLMARDVRIRLHIGGKERIYALLDKGAVDLAVTASEPNSRDLDYQAIDLETLTLLAAPRWIKQHLSKPVNASAQNAQSINPEQLLAQPLIAYDEDLPLVREYFKQVFGTKLDVQAAITVADLRMVRSLILAEQGYSVLPRYLCETELQQGQLIPIHNPVRSPTNALYLVWNRGNLRHPRVAFACQYFLDELKSITPNNIR